MPSYIVSAEKDIGKGHDHQYHCIVLSVSVYSKFEYIFERINKQVISCLSRRIVAVRWTYQDLVSSMSEGVPGDF